MLVALLGLEFDNQVALVFGSDRLDVVVVVAAGAVFVRLFEILGVLSKNFLSLLSDEHHLCVSFDVVVSTLSVALGTVEPLAAALGPDGYLRV